jgi:hypothetical protein
MMSLTDGKEEAQRDRSPGASLCPSRTFIMNPTWIALNLHTRFAYNAAECRETSMFSWSEEGRE